MNPEHKVQCELMKHEIRTQADDLRGHIDSEGNEIKLIREDIKVIKENHLVHLQRDSSVNTTNITWLIDNHKSMRNAVYGALASGIIGLVVNLIK